MSQVGELSFAVEYVVLEHADNRNANATLEGHMCLLLDGQRIGNWDRTVSLNLGTVAVAAFLENRGKRNKPELMQESTERLFRTIYEALYVDRGQSDQEVEVSWDRYYPLLGVPGFESFDDWHAVLVEGADVARFVWRHSSDPASVVQERRFAPGLVDDVLAMFLAEMRERFPQVVAGRVRPTPFEFDV